MDEETKRNLLYGRLRPSGPLGPLSLELESDLTAEWIDWDEIHAYVDSNSFRKAGAYDQLKSFYDEVESRKDRAASRRTLGSQQWTLIAPSIFGLIGALVLVLTGLVDLDASKMSTVSNLCATLLAAATIEIGIVAAIASRQLSGESQFRVVADPAFEETFPRTFTAGNEIVVRAEEASMRKSVRLAGAALFAAAALIVISIFVGAVATPHEIWQILCLAGFLVVLLQLFAGPMAHLAARNNNEPSVFEIQP